MARTGQMSDCSELSFRCCVTVAPLSPFFCLLNVIVTVSASHRRSWSVVINVSSFFRKRTSSVLTTDDSLPLPTSEYSHDRIAKKNATTTSWPIATSISFLVQDRTLRITSSGTACWGVGPGSSSAYFFSCKARRGSIRPAASWIGLSSLLSRKV